MSTSFNLDRANEFFSETPMAHWLQTSVREENGPPVYRLTFHEKHIGNPVIRALHGGVIGAYLETIMQGHLIACAPEMSSIRTVSFSVDYLRSSKPQDMHAEVTIERQGRRLAFLSARGWQNENSKPVALAHAALRTD
ncbi:MAG: PaaI family thioesterase [Pseudomonadota bacterium]